MCLPPAAMGAAASELEAGDLWFSLSVDSDLLSGGKQAKPLMGELDLLEGDATDGNSSNGGYRWWWRLVSC